MYKSLIFRYGFLVRSIVDRVVWLLRSKRTPLTGKTFTVNGKHYSYFTHPHNHTWANERAVEIPIIWEILSAGECKRILEVGNVLSHYFPISHDVVDKHESSRRHHVIREDITEFSSKQGYDVIVSISTIEHIGWEESPKSPDKPLAALRKITELLADGGEAVVTLPTGYNPHLDEGIRSGRIKFAETLCLTRVSKDNEWVSTDLDTVMNCAYDSPYPNANGLVIGFLRAPQPTQWP